MKLEVTKKTPEGNMQSNLRVEAYAEAANTQGL